MLELKNVVKSYAQPGGGSLRVLDIPQLSLAASEQMVLIGRSGSGKSTLLQVIAGITRADEGEVLVDGYNISKLSEAGRDRYRAAKIGFVFQTFNLLAGFTAVENVRLGMTFGSGNYDGARAGELLQRVGLGDRLHYRPSQLSVGQQQRVAIARALASKPKLLLADEPTAAVDPANQQAIIDLIRATCRDEGVSLLLVTHSREVAGQFDRVEDLETINRVVEEIDSTASPAASYAQ